MNDLPDLMHDSLTTRTIKFISDSIFSCKTNGKSFFILHQNIRSLRQNFDFLIGNLESFVNLPEIIFVSEIWIYSCEVEDYHIPNYNFFANTNDTYSSGGVGVFVSNLYECDVKVFNLRSADVIKVCCEYCKEIFNFVCVYRLHSSPPNVFLDELSNFLTNERSGNLLLF